MYGTSMAAPAMVVTRPYDRSPRDPGNGTMVAIVMDEAAKVDAFHAKALELGGTDEGAPGFRGDPSLGYYFAYFRDPDGHKFAVFHLVRNGRAGPIGRSEGCSRREVVPAEPFHPLP